MDMDIAYRIISRIYYGSGGNFIKKRPVGRKFTIGTN
jgi:hypothetical protein